MNAEQEALVHMMEECAEAIKVAAKALQHGLENRNPHRPYDGTNRECLENELGDVRWATLRLAKAGAIDMKAVADRADRKERQHLAIDEAERLAIRAEMARKKQL